MYLSSNSGSRSSASLVGTLIVGLLYSPGCRDGSGSGTALETSPENVCKRNLLIIGKALRSYEQVHGRLLSNTVPFRGDRYVGWRTAIAPYILHQSFDDRRFDDIERICDQYCADEPWDSTHNQRWAVEVTDPVGRIFRCPSDCEAYWSTPLAGKDITSFVMLIRPQPAHLLPDAVIIVESAGCGILWNEPADLDLSAVLSDDVPFGLGKLNSAHKEYIYALRRDGQVITIAKNLSREQVRSILEGAGGRGQTKEN